MTKFKLTKQWESFQDFDAFIAERLLLQKMSLKLKNKTHIDKLTTSNVISMIIDKFNIKYIDILNQSADQLVDENNNDFKLQYFIQDYKDIGLWKPLDINDLCRHICLKEPHFKLTSLIKEFSLMFDQSSMFMKNSLEPLRLPPDYLILTAEGLFDLKTKELITDENVINQYDYVDVDPDVDVDLDVFLENKGFVDLDTAINSI